MKKLILPFLFFTIHAQAQTTEKGTLMLGADLAGAGSLQFGGFNGSLNSGGVNPEVGYFLKNNFAAGIRMNLTVASGNNYYYGVTPFARYYLPVKDMQRKKLRIFGEVSAGVTGTYTKGLNEQDPAVYRLSAGVGAACFIAPGASLEAGVNLTRTSDDYDITLNPNIAIGFKFYLNRHAAKPAGTGEEPVIITNPTDRGGTLIAFGTATANRYYSNRYYYENNLSLYGKAGYFVLNNLMIGATVNGAYSKGEWYAGGGTYSGSAEPFVRYYVPVKRNGKEHKLRFFGEISAGYGGGSYAVSEQIGNGPVYVYRETYSYHTVGAGVGANYFLTPHVSLETGFNYHMQADDNITYYQERINMGVNVFLFKKNK